MNGPELRKVRVDEHISLAALRCRMNREPAAIEAMPYVRRSTTLKYLAAVDGALAFRDATAARKSERRNSRAERGQHFEIRKMEATWSALLSEIDLTAFDRSVLREKRRKRTTQISDHSQKRLESAVVSG
jgi:hypothetical protein